MYMKAEAKRLKRDYNIDARYQCRGLMLREPLSITVRFYFKDNRRRDVDNFKKLIFDALTGVVYADDSLIVAEHTYKAVDREKPRVEITVN
jgi:Holliday junction resolvase RusA-like endonuclease